MKKNYLFLFIILLMFENCTQNSTIKEKLNVFDATSKIEAQNMDVMKKMIYSFNQRDTNFVKFLTSDYQFFSPSATSAPIRAIDELHKMKKYWADFPVFNWNIEEMLADSNIVVTRVIINGVHKSGAKISFSAILMDSFENGKISNERNEADMISLLRQIGYKITRPN